MNRRRIPIPPRRLQLVIAGARTIHSLFASRSVVSHLSLHPTTRTIRLTTRTTTPTRLTLLTTHLARLSRLTQPLRPSLVPRRTSPQW